MDSNDYWNRFECTGNVSDYLGYRKENQSYGNTSNNSSSYGSGDKSYGSTGYGERHDSYSYTNWGI